MRKERDRQDAALSAEVDEIMETIPGKLKGARGGERVVVLETPDKALFNAVAERLHSKGIETAEMRDTVIGIDIVDTHTYGDTLYIVPPSRRR